MMNLREQIIVTKKKRGGTLWINKGLLYSVRESVSPTE